MPDELRRRLAEIEDIGAAAAVLHYDSETVMPAAGSEARSEILATMARLAHERQTAPELAELLDAADPADPVVRIARRDAEKACRVPTDLVAELTRAGAAGQHTWEIARPADDFAAMAPHFEHQIALHRQYAACFADLVDEPYDALLDDYEPGMRTAEVRTIFADLRAQMPALIAQAAEHAAPPLAGPFDIGAQRTAVDAVLARVGFDPGHWVLGVSAHPFSSTMHRGDNRITTRYSEDNLDSIPSALHEFGHGLYEAQVAPEYDRTPVANGTSMGVHESQSRFWEVFVGGSEAFWRGAWPTLSGALGDAVAGVDPAGFIAATQAVRPSLIRVESDPVSYPLHIVLRFELELALISGDLSVADLPAAWNDGMRDLLGIDVPDDRRGVLQDVHWPSGSFGYFPTYALGTILAAQIWQVAGTALPGLDEQIESGDFAPLRAWLGERFHRHGRALDPRDLIRQAIGTDLDAGAYLAFAADRAAGRYE